MRIKFGFSFPAKNSETGTRPRIELWLSLPDRIVEIAALALTLAGWAVMAATFAQLPENIPLHYSITGEPDGFGAKIKIVILPAAATVLYILMTLINRFPHIFNYPVPITEANALIQYRNMTKMVRYQKLILVATFVCIELQTVRVASGLADGLGMLLMPVLLALIILPAIYFIVKSYLNR